ncbi:MAG: hypothetical protein ACI9DC_004853 [Gammaproteobacteria bacterium]|jgi:hypothetical protein
MTDDEPCGNGPGDDANEWPFTAAGRRALGRDAEAAFCDAAMHCVDCRWYHASWTMWRALELASGADLHRRFFRDALPALAPGPRVLISGSGDNALLSVAADALGSQARSARIHVLDRCATPLAACRRFADEQQLDVHCHLADALHFDDAAGFDLILVHAFFGFIEPAQRADLFSRWYDGLASGGHLMLVQRLRPGTNDSPVRFSASQTQRFVDDVHGAALAFPERVSLDAEALEQTAREYALSKLTHPVADGELLQSLCTGAGFRIVSCTGTTPCGDPGDSAGPTLRNLDGYLHVVARKN